MKNKTFGNIIESEPLYITTPKLNNDGEIEYKGEKPIYENSKNFNRFHSNGIEFYNQEDKVSARDFNRPIRQLYEDTENIYGRGTIDMKGSVAVLLELFNNIDTKKKIALFITSDEEQDGNCVYELLKICHYFNCFEL